MNQSIHRRLKSAECRLEMKLMQLEKMKHEDRIAIMANVLQSSQDNTNLKLEGKYNA